MGEKDKAARFLDLRCLLALAPVKSEILVGEDWNFSGELDAGEDDGAESWPPDDRNGVLRAGLARLVTMVGEGKVNPNLAPPEALLAVPGVSARIADEIAARRAGSDGVAGTEDDLVFRRLEDLRELGSVSRFREVEYAQMAPHLRVASNCFTLRICAAERRAGKNGRLARVQECVRRDEKGKLITISHIEDRGY